MENYEKIAAVTHEALREWGELNGDFSMPTWDKVESLYKSHMIKAVINQINNLEASVHPPLLPWKREGRNYTRKYLPRGRVSVSEGNFFRYNYGLERIFKSTVLTLRDVYEDPTPPEYKFED